MLARNILYLTREKGNYGLVFYLFHEAVLVLLRREFEEVKYLVYARQVSPL